MKTILVAVLFFLSAPNVYSQICNGDFDCDHDVDGTDAVAFKSDFFRKDCPDCPPSEDCQAWINEHTDEICEGYICDPPAPVPKTGQTTAYGECDDGVSQSGVAWPNPRFTDNSENSFFWRAWS